MRSRPGSSPPSLPARLARPAAAVTAVLILLALAHLATFDARLHINGDNVAYIRLAQDIRHGQSWWPPSRFPPGLPWLLLPVQLVSGVALVPQKLLVTLCGLLAAFCGARAAVRRWGTGSGAVMAILGFSLVPVIEYSHYVLSEIPYLACLAALVWWLDGRVVRQDRPGETRTGVIAALLAAAAFWIRSTGLAVLLVVPLVLLARGRRRAALWSAGTAGVLLLPYIVRTLSGGGGRSYLRQFFLVNPYHPHFGTVSLSDLATRVAVNFKEYAFLEIPNLVWPVHFRSTYTEALELGRHLPVPAIAAILLLFGLGLFRALRRRAVWGWLTAASLGAVLLWPPVWSSSRFLLPVAPFLMWAFLLGAHRFGRWILGRRAVWSAGLVAAVVGVLAVVNLAKLEAQNDAYPPAWAGYFRAARWARENTPSNILIIDRKPGLFGFVSRRRCEGFPREPDGLALIRDLQRRGADLVVLSRIPFDDITRYLLPAIGEHPEWFEVIYQDAVKAPGETYLFHLLREPRSVPEGLTPPEP
ncbi:MAG: DUF2029 domain-containing protein [Candidatus Eisenbacteria bacterium]|nr:DUF2029 domain-containing protein [Candidatus Eisenbacteria bacterium]